MFEETRYEMRLREAKERLEKDIQAGDITEEDGKKIWEYVEYSSGLNKESTVENHIDHIRKTAKRADKSLLELEIEELLELLRSFKAGTHKDVKDDGIILKNYISALRNFYEYHGIIEDRNVISVEEDYSGRELEPEDLLYKEDVDALLTAARRRNPRDMALIALMLSTGQRADAVITLRRKHVEIDGPAMSIRLNKKDGALKNAKGTRPLLWAKHYVRPWYESHPHRGNPEAPLFPPEEEGRNAQLGPDEKDHQLKPMGHDTLRGILNRRAEDAGLDKDIYPHLLRHSAITRMAMQENLNEQQIKRIVGWKPGSSQFNTYVTIAHDLADDSVRESLGLPTSKSGAPVVGRPSLERCPECNDEIPEGSERCHTCRTALTHSEALKESEIEEAKGAVDDALWASQKQADSQQQFDDLDTARKLVKENPNAVFEALEETGAMDTLADKLAERMD